MTLVISAADVRIQARLGADDTSEDAYLGLLIATAQAIVEGELGRPLITAIAGDKGWANQAAIPPNVIHAVKLIVTELYDRRGADIGDLEPIRRLIGRYVIVGMA